MDSKLKLQIITALDAAGIKATKDQIAGLETQLAKVNQKQVGSIDSVEKSLGKLPGVFGKLNGLLGTMGSLISKGASLVGSFFLGWQIGEKIVDKVLSKFGPWQDVQEKIRKENTKLVSEAKAATQAFETQQETLAAASEKAISALDDQIKKVNNTKEAYARAAQSASRFFNAGQDVEIQRLERERFEDILKLESAGDYEGAEQANRMYDILRKQIEAKKQIVSFDRETLALEEKHAAEIEANDRLHEKAEKAYQQRMRAQRYLENAEFADYAYNPQKYVELENKAKKQLERALQIERAADEAARADDERLSQFGIDQATRQRQRATLVDQLGLDIDRAAAAYDQLIGQQGDVLNMGFSKEFAEQLNQSSLESYDVLTKINANTADLGEKLDALLQIKS